MSKKLKHADKAQVGERIRSYDFEGRKDCYIEGEVKAIRYQGYHAFVVLVDTDCLPRTKQESEAKKTNIPTRVGHTVYVPMEVAFMDYDDRIVNLT